MDSCQIHYHTIYRPNSSNLTRFILLGIIQTYSIIFVLLFNCVWRATQLHMHAFMCSETSLLHDYLTFLLTLENGRKCVSVKHSCNSVFSRLSSMHSFASSSY